MSVPPAGWYSDPGGSGGHRYWNGRAWTAQVSPPLPDEGAPGAEADSSLDIPHETKPLGDPGSDMPPPVPSDSYGDAPDSPALDIPPPDSPLWREGAPVIDQQQVPVDPRVKVGPDGQVLAGFGRRLLGYVIDSVLIAILMSLAMVMFGAVSGVFDDVIDPEAFDTLAGKIEADPGYQPGVGELSEIFGSGFMTLVVMGMLIFLILSMLNGVVLVARTGQTIGDRIVRTRKVVRGRRPPSLGAALLRWLIPTTLNLASNLAVVGFAAMAAFVVENAWMLWDDKRQTWHDKAAGTVVERSDLAGPVIK